MAAHHLLLVPKHQARTWLIPRQINCATLDLVALGELRQVENENKRLSVLLMY
jgi:hypothetical protein